MAAAKGQALLTGKVTFLRRAAVLIPHTANFGTSDNGVPLQALGAEAVCPVEVHLALCSLATADAAAGVNALLGNAGLGHRAVAIHHTFVCKGQELLSRVLASVRKGNLH